MTFINSIQQFSDFIWTYPLLILLLVTGIYLTISFRGFQFRTLGRALCLIFKKEKVDTHTKGDITHFQALMTALAATVGTGNIVGVATAIAIGGPGAVFWMWITGLLGMASKFAESLLGVKYRIVNEKGEISGGPMYYIEKALHSKFPAYWFAFFGAFAAIGIGNMVQSNSIAEVLFANQQIPVWITGIVLTILTALVILKGIKSIGKVTGTLVPLMIGVYLIGGLFILALHYTLIPDAFLLIIRSAFTPTAATGGFLGAGIVVAMRMGVSRGLLSNESGLGSAPIAAAAAKTKQPMTQALISMTQTFIDTLLVCTITALIIIVTGAWNSGLNGATLTSHAFSLGFFGLGNYIVMFGLILFAFSTIIGWSYYGEKFIEFIFGIKAVPYYRVVFVLAVGLGAILQLQLVWAIGEIGAALMAFPNLLALLILAPVIKTEIKEYNTRMKKIKEKKNATKTLEKQTKRINKN